MNNKISYFALGFAILALALAFLRPAQNTALAKQETAYERIIRTQTIRCGYGLWTPEMVKDPTTGALSGYDYDITNAVGQVLGLKVEWTEEAGWGVAEEGMTTHRYDMYCNGVWPSPPRTKAAFYSRPFVYSPVYVFASAKTKVPEGQDIGWINQPDVKIAVLPGAAIDTLAGFEFPKAQKYNMPDLATDGDLMLSVASGKADIGTSTYSSIKKFMDANPGQIQLIDHPIIYEGGAFLMPQDDYRLKQMIDFAVDYLLETGVIRQILLKDLPDSEHEWRYPATEHEM